MPVLPSPADAHVTQVRYAPDIIAVTETRIKYTVPISLYIILICRVINLYMLILTRMLGVLVFM